MSNVDTGNLTGTSGTDSITLTGAQLNAILIGSGTINLGSGTGDTINLTSTSSDLNTLGRHEHIDPGRRGDLRGDGRGWRHDHAVGSDRSLLDHRQRQADTITGGEGADTIAAGAGNDTINLANGQFVAGESIQGGANSDTIVLTNGTTVDFSTGTVSASRR